jgi:hypothetical protein
MTAFSLTILVLSCYPGANARPEVHNTCGNSTSLKRRATCRPQNGTDLIVPLIPVTAVRILLPSRLQSLPFSPLPTTSAEASIGTMVRLPPNLLGDLSVSVKSLEVRLPVSSTT